MSSLNGLRAYRKWLHRQGCTDWDDWETLVDIVVGKSELWDLPYLSEGGWDALDEGWEALGYWSYWDSAIHYLDVWIDFNEPWDDCDEEVAKRSRASFRPLHTSNSFKAKPPPDSEGDNAGADDTGEKHSDETSGSPYKNSEGDDSSKTRASPGHRPGSRHQDLRPPNKKPEDRNSDNNNSSETQKLTPEKELDFMTAEVKAQIGRMDERITQILGWTQKQSEGVDPALDPLELEKLEQKNANLRTELAKANDDKTRLTNRINELECRDSNRDEILLLLEEKLDHLTQKQQQQQASLDETLAKLTQTLQDKVNFVDQVTTLQREKRQLQNQLEQTQTELTQKNDSFTAQLNSLSEENNQSIAQLNDSKTQNALLQQERSHLQTRLKEAEQEIANLAQEKLQLLTLTEQANQERSHLLEERQGLQTTLAQRIEELQFLQSQSSERSHLLEEANHQLNILTQTLSPTIQSLNTQFSEFMAGDLAPETQAFLEQLVAQLAITQEQLQQISPVALPLLEGLREEQARLQSEIFNIQARLEHSEQEKATLRADFDAATLELCQAKQNLENSEQKYAQFQQDIQLLREEKALYLEIKREDQVRIRELEAKNTDLTNKRDQCQLELTNRQNQQNQLEQIQQELDQAKQELAKSEEIRQGLWDRLSQVDRGAKDWFRGLFNKD